MVASIQSILTVIGTVGKISADISTAIEEQSSATREIVRNIEQAANGTSAVSSNVVGVRAAADQTGHASEEVLEASHKLTAQADDLRQRIDDFLKNIRITEPAA